jgi:protein ImuB
MCGVAVPAQDDEFTAASWTLKRRPGDPPRRPLRLLQKPEEIEAGLPFAPDGPPKYFRWRQCRHDVTRAEGPERIAMEWWRSVRASGSDQNKPPGLTRDYFRVETKDGQRFWLYRDGLYQQNGFAPRWYLQGLFA